MSKPARISRQKRSVKTTFILAIIIFSLIQSILLGSIAASRLGYELEEQFKDRAIDLTEHIAQEAFFSAFLQQGAGLSSMVQGLVNEDVLYAQIVVRGKVAAEDNPLELDLPIQLVPGGVHLEKRFFDGTAYLDVTRALLGRPEDLEQNSYIRLGISLAYVEFELKQEFIFIGSAALAVALLGVGVAFILYRLILSPLDRLARAVRRFGQQEFDVRAPQMSWKEMDGLATEFNTMADAIVSMKTQLEKDSQAKSEFLTIVGHELRTPLHSILGYAELLSEQIGGDLTPEQSRQVQSLRESGDHLLALVESILHYAKLEMGQESLHYVTVSAKNVVQETVDLIRPLAEKKGLQFIVNAPSGQLQADRTKLKEILSNLLQNAIQYTPSGSIRLDVDEQEDAIVFHIMDEGPGIAPDDQEKVFAPFTQLEEIKRRSSKGLGLGLTIVKRYTELHGGTVSLTSASGEGSRFSVRLPKHPDRGGA